MTTATPRPMADTVPAPVPACSATTRALLGCGVVAGPAFHASVLVQEMNRDGFDPRRHPLSLLGLGQLGWIQVTTFVVTGLLVVLSAVGLRAALRSPSERARTWGPILFAVNGLTLVVAGVFRADPYHGYPIGSAEVVTWHGTVHNIAPTLSGVAGLACFAVFVRRFAGLGQRGWVVYSVVTPVLVLALSVVSVATSDFRVLVLGDAVGWLWTSAVLVHVLRGSPRQGAGDRAPRSGRRPAAGRVRRRDGRVGFSRRAAGPPPAR